MVLVVGHVDEAVSASVVIPQGESNLPSPVPWATELADVGTVFGELLDAMIQRIDDVETLIRREGDSGRPIELALA